MSVKDRINDNRAFIETACKYKLTEIVACRLYLDNITERDLHQYVYSIYSNERFGWTDVLPEPQLLEIMNTLRTIEIGGCDMGLLKATRILLGVEIWGDVQSF